MSRWHPHASSVKFKATVNVFKRTAKSVYALCEYVQVSGLAHVRTTEQPIRRTAHLSLKNRNESTTTTNERNYASLDGGERSFLLRAIARSAPIRENEREWKIAIQHARSIRPRALH